MNNPTLNFKILYNSLEVCGKPHRAVDQKWDRAKLFVNRIWFGYNGESVPSCTGSEPDVCVWQRRHFCVTWERCCTWIIQRLKTPNNHKSRYVEIESVVRMYNMSDNLQSILRASSVGFDELYCNLNGIVSKCEAHRIEQMESIYLFFCVWCSAYITPRNVSPSCSKGELMSPAARNVDFKPWCDGSTCFQHTFNIPSLLTLK